MPDTNDSTITQPSPILYDINTPKEEVASEHKNETQTVQPLVDKITSSISPIPDEVPINDSSSITPSPVYQALYGNENGETEKEISTLVQAREKQDQASEISEKSFETSTPSPESSKFSIATTETQSEQDPAVTQLTPENKYSRTPETPVGDIPGEQTIADQPGLPGVNKWTYEGERHEKTLADGHKEVHTIV
jgi:hypothetical protein